MFSDVSRVHHEINECFSLTRQFSLVGLGVAGRPYPPQMSAYNIMPLNNEQSSGPVPETVRSYFPETWIWELVAVE